MLCIERKGWGRKHSVVDYVFKYDMAHLFAYHRLVMHEIGRRGYLCDGHWYSRFYRGNSLPPSSTIIEVGSYTYPHVYEYVFKAKNLDEWITMTTHHADVVIYPEHDIAYLKECLLNLKAKGAELVNGVTAEELLVNIDILEQ